MRVLSLIVVPVSSKPKEPRAAVVAPGRSSAQPSVWQGALCRRRRSGTEVRGGEGGGLSSSTSFISLRNRTLKDTVKSHTGLVMGGEKKMETKSPRAETTNFYTRSCDSFPRRCHDAPRFLDRTMFLFWYKCGVVVLYSTLFLFDFLHFRHVSISDDLHWPWECLILCILPEWVLRNLHRKDKTSLGDQTSSKSPKRQLLRAKRFAPQRNRRFSLCFVFFFSLNFFSPFPKLISYDILPQYQSFSTANQTIKRALLFSNKAFWACVLHFKQSKHQEVVWTEYQCMAVKCSNWKNVNLSNN